MSESSRCYALLGHPIAHSRSPVMHEAAFEALGEPHRYMAFDVRPEALRDAIRGAAALGFGGLNVTVPHKQAALSWVDELSPAVQRVGALNTIALGPNGTHGYGTDGRGFRRALDELDHPPNRRAVVLGGGGASLWVVDALTHGDDVYDVTWVSRDPSKLPKWAGTTAASWGDLGDALTGAGLLVQATSVGMDAGPANFPRDPNVTALAEGAAVIDLVYPRVHGGLLDRAERAGLRVQDGIPMLVWQGVAAQELWRGCALPRVAIEAMRRAVRVTPILAER